MNVRRLSVDNEHICSTCGEQPCEWLDYGDCITEHTPTLYTITNSGEKLDYNRDIVSNNVLWKKLYKCFIHTNTPHLERVIVYPFLSVSLWVSGRYFRIQTTLTWDSVQIDERRYCLSLNDFKEQYVI